MLHPFVNTAVRAARRAGDIIVRNLENLDRIDVQSKGRADWVSDVDRKAEQEVVEILQRAYPDIAVLGEEGGLIGAASSVPDESAVASNSKPRSSSKGRGRDALKKNDHAELCWVIDPLDGTTNFLRGLPHFSVSIGLARGQTIEHGVVYDPVRNELFTASRGHGAQLNSRRIRVSQSEQADTALVGTGFNFKAAQQLEAYSVTCHKLIGSTAGIRRSGSAALDLAYVACGRLDGFFEMFLSPWDIAAGSLLVEEAGGLLTDFSGNGQWYESGHTVAASSGFHPNLLRSLTLCADSLK